MRASDLLNYPPSSKPPLSGRAFLAGLRRGSGPATRTSLR